MKPLEIRDAERKVRDWKRRDRKAKARAHVAQMPAEKKNRGRQRDAAHLAFIRRLPCVATFMQTGQLIYGCDAAHIRFADAARGKPFTGAQRKPDDAWTVPLSRQAHECQHSMSERRFWEDLQVDVLALATDLYSASGDEEAALRIIKDLRQ